MQYFLSEINRTDYEVRAALNSKLRDKRIIFEEIIIRSVRELLNSNNTTLKLEDKQNILNKLTSTRRRRARERFEKATSALQQSTSNAPMGIGSAAGVALNAASTANEIYYERSEQQILEKSAQESLNAAKLNIYTPQSDNYTIIAKNVARELSFSFQPLLLVLAAGANGIVKLAEFTEKSRKKYAVEKLSEYHSTNSVKEIANALIDASIPPVNDTSFYRDFFRLNVLNRHMQLGKHTTLEFDPEVRGLLKLSGLDTEIFFGRTDAELYTIIGALNHSVFLGQNYQLYAGIETPRRAGELLTGSLKYPLRLLAPDKNIGTTGVSFAPRPTGIYLEAAHIEILKKLFPNFGDPNALLITEEEIVQDKVILPDYSNRKYRSERNSVPWSLKRSEDMQRRKTAILSTTVNPGSPEDIFYIPNYAQFQTMRHAGNIFDITYSKNDLIEGAAKTQEIQIGSFGAFDTLNKRRLLLTSAKYSKYLAITTSQYIYCLIKSKSATVTDLTLAARMLDESRTTLNLSRNYPLIEVHHIRKAKNLCKHSLMQIEQSSNLQIQHYTTLLHLSEKFHDAISRHDFLHVIPRLISWKKKNLINKHSILREELTSINDFISALTNYSFMTEYSEELTENDAILSFHQAANLVIEQLYAINNHHNSHDILKKIEICILEIRIINYEITNIFQNAELRPENFMEIKETITIALRQTNNLLTNAQDLVLTRSWLQKKTQNNWLLRQLRTALSEAKQNRDTCETLLTTFKFEFTESPEDQELQTFFSRINAYNKYGRLLLITNDQNNDPILTQRLRNLKTTIPAIYRANEGTIKEQITTHRTDIQEYLTINPSETIETMLIAISHLKDAKQIMEQSFANDAEILSRIHKQAQTAVRDIQTLIQEILTVKDGISSIIRECEQNIFHSKLIFEQKSLEKIYKLRSNLTSTEISAATPDTEISDILENIEQVKQHLNNYQNREELIIKFYAENIRLLDYLLQINTMNHSDTQIFIKDTPPNQPSPISSDRNEELFTSDLWEIWLIFKIFNFTIEQTLTNSDSLSNKLKIAEQNLIDIQNAIDTEPTELIKTRTITIGKIKQAYQYITYAQKEKSKLIDSSPNHDISANILITDNLAWSARPNFNELKYLDEKIESLRKERFEKQQQHKNDTIFINPLLIRYLQVGIEVLKKQLDALSKLTSKIKYDLDNIYRLKLPTDKQETDIFLQNLEIRFTKLLTIAEEKYHLINEKILPLEKCKSDFTKHILRAYFGYLKLEVDILESETQKQSYDIARPLKATPKKISKSIEQKKVTITAADNPVLRAAKKYSFSDLEKHYYQLSITLKQHIAASEHKTLSISDSGSEQEEPAIGGKSKTQPLKIPRVYSDLGNSSSPDLTIFSPSPMRSDNIRPLITEYKSNKKEPISAGQVRK